MKLIAKSIFGEKLDRVRYYMTDTILEVVDRERAANLIRRGFCAEYKGNKAASVTLTGRGPVKKADNQTIRSNGQIA